MIDKITTVPKARLGKRIGKLNDEDSVRLNRALTVLLGLASLTLDHWFPGTDTAS